MGSAAVHHLWNFISDSRRSVHLAAAGNAGQEDAGDGGGTARVFAVQPIV